MIYYRRETVKTTAATTYGALLNKIHAALTAKFTGNNQIMLIGVQMNIGLIPNIFTFRSETANYRLFCNYADGTNQNACYSANMKSSGSEYIIGIIESSKTVSFQNLTSTSTSGAGTYYFHYFEKYNT
jgi:hypothetical protein